MSTIKRKSTSTSEENSTKKEKVIGGYNIFRFYDYDIYELDDLLTAQVENITLEFTKEYIILKISTEKILNIWPILKEMFANDTSFYIPDKLFFLRRDVKQIGTQFFGIGRCTATIMIQCCKLTHNNHVEDETMMNIKINMPVIKIPDINYMI